MQTTPVPVTSSDASMLAIQHTCTAMASDNMHTQGVSYLQIQVTASLAKRQSAARDDLVDLEIHQVLFDPSHCTSRLAGKFSLCRT
jgi:hypothetical protein